VKHQLLSSAVPARMSSLQLEALALVQRLEAADSERLQKSCPLRVSTPPLHVIVFGATGYMGFAVVQELSRRGHAVTAVVRAPSRMKVEGRFKDVRFEVADVLDNASLHQLTCSGENKPDAVVCCLASRQGGKHDAWQIDFKATVNCVHWAQAVQVPHFVLLSAICVQRPQLAFHAAKLAAEKELRLASESGMKYTIVQPTAFIKSLVSQVARLKVGSRFVIFGDGDVRCTPIGRQDLAAFIVDCVCHPRRQNATLPIGGPGPALSKREQGLLMFQLLQKVPKFLYVPIFVLDFVEVIARAFAWLLPSRCSDAPEFAKIVRFYATESMLVLDPRSGCYREDLTPSFGKTSLRKFLTEALQPGSQLLYEERMGEAGLWKE